MKILAPVLICAIHPIVLLGQTDVRLGASNVIMWEAVTTDITGGAEVIASYDVYAFSPGVDLVASPDTTPLSKLSIEGTKTEAIVGALKLTHGARVRIAVRAVDLAGNRGDWSDPIDATIDLQKPKKPSKPWWRFW